MKTKKHRRHTANHGHGNSSRHHAHEDHEIAKHVATGAGIFASIVVVLAGIAAISG